MQSSSTRSGGIGVFNDDIVEEAKHVAVADDRMYSRVPESIGGANIIGNQEDVDAFVVGRPLFQDITHELNIAEPRVSVSPSSIGAKKKKKMPTRRDLRQNNLAAQAQRQTLDAIGEENSQLEESSRIDQQMG